MRHLLWTVPLLVAVPFWAMGHKKVSNRMVTIALFMAGGALLAALGPAITSRGSIGIVLGRFHADLGVLVTLTAVGPFGIALCGGSAAQWLHNPPSWRSIAWRLFIYTTCAWSSLLISSGMTDVGGPFLWGSTLIFTVGATVLAYPALFGVNFLQPNDTSSSQR